MKNYIIYLRMLTEKADLQERTSQTAYILGAGLSGLAAAYMLVSKTVIPGRHIHVLEKESLPGGKYRDSRGRYEQYVLPFLRYLQWHDVRFHYDATVTNVVFGTLNHSRIASQIELQNCGRIDMIGLTEDDHVISTIGTRIDAKNFVSIDRFPVALRDRLLQNCKEEAGGVV